jgi:uncharacterized protein YutD
MFLRYLINYSIFYCNHGRVTFRLQFVKETRITFTPNKISQSEKDRTYDQSFLKHNTM